MIRTLIVATFAVMALSACGDESDSVRTADRGRAEGEVQGGTISDAMIPFDSLTSQSPPMRRPESETAEGDSQTESEEADGIEPEPGAEDSAVAEPTPAASPEPAPADE